MGVLGMIFETAAVGTLAKAGLDQSPQGPIERAVSHVSNSVCNYRIFKAFDETGESIARFLFVKNGGNP